MIKDLLKEMAAGGDAGVTSAGSVAGFREPIGKKSKSKKKRKMTRRPIGLPYSFHLVGESASFQTFLHETEAEDDFDRADVIAKLKTAAKSAEDKGSESAGFALEDEKGNIVKVWVPDDQADNFGQALQHALAGADENEDDQNDSVEIAEVLWKLRKQFDIINVEWGEIPEDEEEPLEGGEGEMGLGGDAGLGGEGGEGGELGIDAEGGDLEGGEMEADPAEVADLGAEGASEEGAATALTQVIDMMKADANARKAEAEARTAEANARASTEKVKQEEETLDMEAYYKDKKEVEDETKRIAKLAKYKHDVAADDGDELNSGNPMAGGAPDIEVEKNVDVNIEPERAMEPEMEEIVQRPRRGNNTSISKAELGDMLLKALRR